MKTKHDSETQGCKNIQELKELNINPTVTMNVSVKVTMNRIRYETKTTEYKYKETNQETML